ARQALRGLARATRSVPPGSAVWPALMYAATLDDSTRARYVVVCSDLEEHEGGRHSRLPLSTTLPFERAHVTVLFVPDLWRDAALERAWRDFFTASGAATAVLVEAGRSRACRHLIPASSVPHLVPSPLLCSP